MTDPRTGQRQHSATDRGTRRALLIDAVARGQSPTAAMRASGYRSLSHVRRLIHGDATFQIEVDRRRADLGVVPPVDLAAYPVEFLPAFRKPEPGVIMEPVDEDFAQLSPGERALVIAAKLDVGAAHAADFLGGVIQDEDKADDLRLAAAKVLVRARTAGPTLAVQINGATDQSPVNVQALLVDPTSADLAAQLLSRLGEPSGNVGEGRRPTVARPAITPLGRVAE